LFIRNKISDELRDFRHQLSRENPLKLLKYYKEKKKYKNDLKKNFSKDDFQYYICIAAIVRDEADYIAEWIEYHLYVGIQKFYIYDNGSEDNTKDILMPYMERGIVEYHYWPGKKREYYKYKTEKEKRRVQKKWHKKQHSAYFDAINRSKYSTFWLAIIDLDEFIVPVSTRTIPEFLYDFEDEAGIEVFWLLYGNSGHIKKTNQLVIERFQYHSLSEYWENRLIKLIFNPRHVFLKRNHDAWFFDGRKAVNSNRFICGQPGYSITHDKIRCNHYETKSFEEWLKRRKGILLKESNSPAFIDEFNKEQSVRNVVKDDIIMFKYIEPIKKTLDTKQ
jgi:hypothetical protein